MRQVLVIGAGNFGFTLAAELAEKKIDVIVIDSNQERAQEIKDSVSQVIVADATHKDVLDKFARDIDVAVVSLGEKIDSSILVTLFLKEIGVKRIIAKASSIDHGKVLKIVGANDVVFPERDEALRLATSLVSPDILDFIQLSDEFNIVEVAVPDKFVKKSIDALDLRKKYGMQILAIKNPLDGKINVLPSPDYKFRPDDVMIVIGDIDSLQKIQQD